MNIVVLDDEVEIVEYINNLLKDKDKDNNIYLHTSHEDLEKSSYFKNIDILYIDIKLSGINGIDFVKQHERIFTKTKIIYITGYDDFIEDTFETEYIYFLRKPLNEEKILKSYKKAMDKIILENKNIIVSNQNGMRKIKVNDIYYIESDARKINVYLKNECITSYKKLSDIENELNNNFLRIHKSYIVNIEKIKNYSPSKVILENNKVISISRLYQKKCREIIMNYLKEGDE